MHFWEWEPVFRLNPRQTGLLIIDMQNGFVEPGAPLEVPMTREQLPALAGLLGFFRQRGLPVIHTAFCATPRLHYRFYHRMAAQRGLRLEGPGAQFRPGSHECAITPELAPLADESVVWKTGYDAFAHTELEILLHAAGVRDLVIAGTVVDWCVDSTVRSAYHRFFNVVVVADGVSGYDHAGRTGEDWRQSELDLFAEAFGRVMKAEEIRRELEDAWDGAGCR